MEQLRDAPWIRRAWHEGYEPGAPGEEGEEDGAEELCPMLPRWLWTGAAFTATDKEEKAHGQTFCEL